MSRSGNVLAAIRDRDFARFLQILDDGAKAACREATYQSHKLGLYAVDGRAPEALKRKPRKTS